MKRNNLDTLRAFKVRLHCSVSCDVTIHAWDTAHAITKAGEYVKFPKTLKMGDLELIHAEII